MVINLQTALYEGTFVLHAIFIQIFFLNYNSFGQFSFYLHKQVTLKLEVMENVILLAYITKTVSER